MKCDGATSWAKPIWIEYADRSPGEVAYLCWWPADWFPRAFLFPSDQKMDLEPWAEDADFTPQELHQMRIQDNQLFKVSPKSGTLLPKQEKSVQLSHR